MDPVLFVSAWPSAQESVLPRDHFNVGWVSGEHDSSIPELLDALETYRLEEWRFFLLGDEEIPPSGLSPRVTWCDLRGQSAGHVVATLDAIILPSAALAYWRELVEAWVIPPLVLSKLKGGGSLAVTVDPDDTASIADNMARLLTDPPFRRQCLGRLRSSTGATKPHGYWRVEGVFDSSYSLALVNRQLAMAMSADLNRSVALLTYEQGQQPSLEFATLSLTERQRVEALWAASESLNCVPDTAFRNAWPPVVRGMRGRLRVLSNYHWEETRFPRKFAIEFNQTLDLITVGSTQTAKFLEDAGVNVPIAVVGDGADHLQICRVSTPKHPIPEGFRFLHVSSCFPRKAIDVVLTAFGHAFAGDTSVALVIKTFSNPHNDVADLVEQFKARHPDGPTVIVFDDDWSDEEMSVLYQACHAYVAPSRGEGFGLPLAEAMLHRLPVITTDWGGHLDFCSEDNSWLVPSTLTPATTHLSLPGSLWAEPCERELSTAMTEVRDAVERGPKSRHASALKLRRRVEHAEKKVRELTWARVFARTQRAIDLLVKLPAPAPVRLGWMTSWGVRCGIASYSNYMTSLLQPKGLLSNQCELHVLAPVDDAPDVQDPSFVHRCWIRGATQSQRDFIRQVILLNLDAVVIQYHWSFFSPHLLAEMIRVLAGAGVSVFLDMHNTNGAPAGIETDFNFLQGLARSARTLVHTLDDVSRVESWGLRDNLTLFPLATYPVPTPSLEALCELRREFGFEGKRVLGSYGFLMPHKGVLELVESMPYVLDAQPQAHLLLVNATYPGSASASLKEQIEARVGELGIADHVTFIADYLSDAESMALLKLAEVVVFPYQHSDESSSAAVRMAISGRCPIAITPLKIFDDVAQSCVTLPGVTPSEIGAGLIDVLRVSNDASWQDQQVNLIDALAREMDANELSARLLGLIQGHLRRVEV